MPWKQLLLQLITNIVDIIVRNKDRRRCKRDDRRAGRAWHNKEDKPPDA